MSNNVTVSGWLRKSPPEKKLRKNAWRKRWFVLRSGRLSGNPNLLEYYKHQGSKKPIGAISLDECLQIDANVPVKYPRKDPATQFVFDIVTRTRIYYLVASSLHEMSFWVRHLCDLCGFNHDGPDNQQDLGSQQQTFRANQSISRGSYQNGTTSLLANEEEPPDDAPPPLPRPERTMTSRSVLIRRGTNGPVTPNDPSGSTSTESNQPSMSGTPGSLRRTDMQSSNGYTYAAETTPSDQVLTSKSEVDGNDDSEYLFLTDFKTAPSSQKRSEPGSLLTTASSFRERRSSSDSVFTHEGAPSDGGSDVMAEQPIHTVTSRFAASRKQRLDSMPDCPPPPPPVKTHTERPLINMIDERGYSFPPDDDDDDVIVEARKRSAPTSGGGLSPIDDSDLNRVPLNMQREFTVDEMGRPIPGGYNTSGYDTEYINTADASAEARFGKFSSQRSEGPQIFPIVGAPFISPNIRPVMSQATSSSMNSSVFFNSPEPSERGFNRHPLYDTPSSMVPMYASPRTASPHHTLSHKSSIYSSTNALSPYGPRASPLRMSSPQPSPAHGPRMRRSSSVGQLESVANDLAAQSGPSEAPPSGLRRSSIDNRHQMVYNLPPHPAMVHPALYGAPVPMDHLVSDFGKANVPPPRPPKLDLANKNPLPDPESSEYFNLSGCYTDGAPMSQIPPSPPHTEVIVFSKKDEEGPPVSSPPHSTIIGTIPVEDTAKREAKEVDEKTSRTSSSSGGSSTGSSSCRSSATAVYDVTASSLRDPSTIAPLYDTPRRPVESSLGGNDIYDAPKRGNDIYDSPKALSGGLYDAPNGKPTALPEINENRPDYERMLDQLPPIGDEVQSYTSMAGATSLSNTPSFKKPPLSPKAGRPGALSEPPPVKRDLKPKHGRASLGSDGGGSDSSKPNLSRTNFDEPHYDQGVRLEPPISPPHAIIMHTIPSTSVIPPSSVDSFAPMRLQDRLFPPERPPKGPSQSSLSPRTPPLMLASSHAPDRPPPYNYDRTRYPDGGHFVGKQKPPPYVPGRPPKPISMIPGASPSPSHRDDSSFRHPRDYGRSHAFTAAASYGNSFPNMSTVVPAPAMDPQEKKLTYVEIGQFEHRSSGAAEAGPSSSDRMSKGDNVVEYSVLDPEKTEALKKMKDERDQLKRESRSVKSGKT